MSNEKQQVLDYSKKAYEQKLVAGTSGNLSMKNAQGNIVITPSSTEYAGMTTEDIVVIDLEGNVLEGHLKPSSEWPMHAAIYKAMPQVNAVVHTHSPYATAFSVLNEEIPVCLIEMVYFLPGGVQVAPVALQGTKDVGEGVVNALKDRGGCLMQNHGAVSIGATMQQAYIRTEYIEDAAKIYHMAKTAGTPTIIPQDMIDTMQKAMEN